jgi:hypothetical protein
MQKLNNNTVNLIKGNSQIMGRLMIMFNKSSYTISRWIEDNDVRLTTSGALQVLREELKMDDTEILEEAVSA